MAGDVSYRYGDGLFLPDQHDQPLTARDTGVEQIPLKHGIMLGEHRDDHLWVFRALAFVEA